MISAERTQLEYTECLFALSEEEPREHNSDANLCLRELRLLLLFDPIPQLLVEVGAHQGQIRNDCVVECCLAGPSIA